MRYVQKDNNLFKLQESEKIMNGQNVQQELLEAKRRLNSSHENVLDLVPEKLRIDENDPHSPYVAVQRFGRERKRSIISRMLRLRERVSTGDLKAYLCEIYAGETETPFALFERTQEGERLIIDESLTSSQIYETLARIASTYLPSGNEVIERIVPPQFRKRSIAYQVRKNIENTAAIASYEAGGNGQVPLSGEENIKRLDNL